LKENKTSLMLLVFTHLR